MEDSGFSIAIQQRHINCAMTRFAIGAKEKDDNGKEEMQRQEEKHELVTP